jgi:hypothetical protein
MTITIRSSSREALADPALLRQKLAAGHVVELTDLDGAVLARPEDIHALADQLAEEELLEHMASYRKDVTGISNTIWISPRGRTRHAARVKVAINPPDSLNPASETASVAVHDGSLVAGDLSPALLEQVRRFIALNRDALVDYWEHRIDTRELDQRLKSIDAR